jgi:hypothetical protein
MEDEATSEPARAAMERTDLTIEARLVHLAHECTNSCSRLPIEPRRKFIAGGIELAMRKSAIS